MAYLNDIPKFAFGTAYELKASAADEHNNNNSNQTTESQFRLLVRAAIELGCRHFDCAPLYGTQRLMGEVLSSQMANYGGRHRFFITSKLPPNMMREERIVKSLRRTLHDLQLSYLDLFLIHAPFSTRYLADERFYPTDQEGKPLLDEEEGLLERAWLMMAHLKERALVRYVGLSNVNIEQVNRLQALYPIDVVQNEYHLFHQDTEMIDHCEELDIHYEAYAGLGSPARAKREGKHSFLVEPKVRTLARVYDLKPAQVLIKWLHQQPLSYVVRSDDRGQLEDNIKATKQNHGSLSMNDLIDLDRINRGQRMYSFEALQRHREYPFKLPAHDHHDHGGGGDGDGDGDDHDKDQSQPPPSATTTTATSTTTTTTTSSSSPTTTTTTTTAAAAAAVGPPPIYVSFPLTEKSTNKRRQ